MPLKHKVYWGVVIVAGLILIEILSRPSSPPLFDEILEAYRKDEDRMASIGGYTGYEYEYNRKQLEKDTIDYHIIIYGRTGNYVLRGVAVKKNDEWQVAEQASEVNGKKE